MNEMNFYKTSHLFSAFLFMQSLLFCCFASADPTQANDRNTPSDTKVINCSENQKIELKLKSLTPVNFVEFPKSVFKAVRVDYQVESDSLSAHTFHDFQSKKKGFVCASAKSDASSVHSIYAPVLLTTNGSKEPNAQGFKKIWQFSILSKPSENKIGLWNTSSRIDPKGRFIGKAFFGKFAKLSFYKSYQGRYFMLIEKTEDHSKTNLLIEYQILPTLMP
jgi:hypothetical protein